MDPGRKAAISGVVEVEGKGRRAKNPFLAF
jgi:hypothetical protein